MLNLMQRMDTPRALFILMKEESPAIWIDKLDWIAENGGMALVNVHPDYLNFENKRKSEQFPISYYTDFLKYIKNNYKDEYWNVCANEIAGFWKSTYVNHRKS